MKKLTKLALVIGLTLSAHVNADIDSKVGDWFTNMNYATSTNPGVYEGQTARYATLGGFSARAPITQPFNLVTVQTPKFSGGCGGIDFYTGGFSAIDADQFVDNLRAIGQNAKSLAFMLAIQVVSPQLSGTMKDINDFANKYLNMNMDSCEAASALVGGALEVLDKDKANCISQRQSHYGEDFSTASWACTGDGQRQATNDGTGEKNEIEFIEGNIAWYVMMQDPFFQADIEFAELVMNIIGTVIITDEVVPGGDGGKIPRVIPAAIADDVVKERFQNIYTAMLYGSNAVNQIMLYECVGAVTANLDGCDQVSGNLVPQATAWAGLYSRIEALLSDIILKIQTDAVLTAPERGLIDSTRVPIYRFLSASTTAFPRGTNINQISSQYTELIAQDILLSAIEAIIQRVETQAGNMKKGMSFSDNVKEYREQLEDVLRGLSKLKDENQYTAEDLLHMRERIAQYEKMLLPKLGNEMVTASLWGQG